jgi:hypothetical protein
MGEEREGRRRIAAHVHDGAGELGGAPALVAETLAVFTVNEPLVTLEPAMVSEPQIWLVRPTAGAF